MDSKQLRAASSKLFNGYAETGKDVAIFSSFSGPIGASSLQSNPWCNKEFHTEYGSDGLWLREKRVIGERIQGRFNGYSSSRHQTTLKRREHNDSSYIVEMFFILNNASAFKKGTIIC